MTYKTSIVGRPREFSDSASDVFQLPPHNSFVKDFETGDFFSRVEKINLDSKNQGNTVKKINLIQTATVGRKKGTFELFVAR